MSYFLSENVYFNILIIIVFKDVNTIQYLTNWLEEVKSQ